MSEAIDTTTPAGRMMMQMVASFAEFKRAMLKERTKIGLDAARKNGRIGGIGMIIPHRIFMPSTASTRRSTISPRWIPSTDHFRAALMR